MHMMCVSGLVLLLALLSIVSSTVAESDGAKSAGHKVDLLSLEMILEVIESDPKLGKHMRNRFWREAMNGWSTMESKFELKPKSEKIGEEKKSLYYNEIFHRFMKASAVLPSTNQNELALRGLIDRNNTAVERGMKRKKDMLCAVFLLASDEDMAILRTNIEKSNGFCEWSVVFFGGDDGLITEFLDSVKAKKFPTVVMAQKYSGPRAASNEAFVPKQLWYPIVSEITPGYKRVWLLDADISLENHNFEKVKNVLDCGNWDKDYETGKYWKWKNDIGMPRGPIISQPLIQENTQYFPIFNAVSWKLAHHITAQRIRFVEQQIPIFNTDFFEWYVDYMVKPWLPVALIMEGTWGFDTTWCGAAEDYVMFHRGELDLSNEEEHKNKNNMMKPPKNNKNNKNKIKIKKSKPYHGASISEVNRRPSVCALIVNSPVNHLKKSNKKSGMSNKHGDALNVAKFYFSGHLMKYWVHDHNPRWVIDMKRALPSRNAENTLALEDLNKNCV